jgi:RimJ/RimL family protein N-acetyltransferase
MTSSLEVVVSPDAVLFDWLCSQRPRDVFCTPQYAAGQELLGRKTFLFKFIEKDGHSIGCLGFLKKGRLSSELELPSVPTLDEDSEFWAGLLQFCKKSGVWDLSVRSFNAITIPKLGGIMAQESGVSFQLKLEGKESMAPSSINHRRMITKAVKAGVNLNRTQSEDGILPHLTLMTKSMDRRAARGELVSHQTNSRYFAAMLKNGAGELAQALFEGEVESSIFVLKSRNGAYYQSAGTSPKGMSVGASPFLISSIAKVYQVEGIKVFDLGGTTDATPGLSRFKQGFGSERVPFNEAFFCVAHPVKRKLRTLARLVRHKPGRLLSQIVCPIVYRVFHRDLDEKGGGAEEQHQLDLAKLNDDELRKLSADYPEFHRQAERLDEFGFNDAYVMRVNGEPAHIAWLVTSEHDKLLPEREVKLRRGEAEITHAYTAEAFRGRGIYPLMIKALCQQAAGMGLKRVYMSVHPSNVSSLRGVDKAGFQLSGRVFRLHSPLLPERFVLRFRGHRW